MADDLLGKLSGLGNESRLVLEGFGCALEALPCLRHILQHTCIERRAHWRHTLLNDLPDVCFHFVTPVDVMKCCVQGHAFRDSNGNVGWLYVCPLGRVLRWLRRHVT